MELGADKEVKICLVYEIQRGETQVLHEPLQRFGVAVSETAIQNRRIVEACAEEQPVEPEKDQHLLDMVQLSRYVHNKLKMQSATARHSDRKRQISPPNGMSGLVDIVHLARLGKFEHCKVSRGSEQSERGHRGCDRKPRTT